MYTTPLTAVWRVALAGHSDTQFKEYILGFVIFLDRLVKPLNIGSGECVNLYRMLVVMFIMVSGECVLWYSGNNYYMSACMCMLTVYILIGD